MEKVARFLYGRDDAWPLSMRDFEHGKLTDSLLILNLFVSHNIDPSTHYTTISDPRARFLYHLTHGRKIDLGSYIYTLINTMDFQTDKRHTTIFLALISGICEEVKVQISIADPVMKAKGPINRHALKNARRHTARAVRITPAIEEQPEEEHLATPQSITPSADMTTMLLQILEGQAEHTSSL
ncbi:Uncharacterized protein Adt_27448 [Abeliophyllum distichum]|uniref:Putative plant transposon protein domain-containing protein n=1 Tax=Abeliophyllum distichum TaxID=126358 RepID=A0ABD1RTS5_9LAMI